MAQNPDHQDNIIALKRIEGQIRGVQRMVEERQYCIDILNQILAVKGALASVEEKILQKHFRHCVTTAITGNSEKQKQQKLDEIIALINRTRRG
jgi:DNA-binding FrmR family transcriptional regulator